LQYREADIELPGIRIRARKGPGPTDQDRQFMGNLRLASPGRTLLDNMRPSRARSGISRTFSRTEMEAYLDRMIAQRGEDGINAMRDDARKVADALGAQREMVKLDRLVGAMLGSRDDVQVSSPAARARAGGNPYDARRLDIFEALRVALASRIMMNAELEEVGEQRILIPIVFRNNYLAALRALSRDMHCAALIKVLDFAQRYAAAIPWDSFDQARHVLAGTNAFMKPDQAEEEGIRLRLPSAALLQGAEDLFPPAQGSGYR
jgi:hypothetical protein